jgi:hypothetical protein
MVGMNTVVARGMKVVAMAALPVAVVVLWGDAVMNHPVVTVVFSGVYGVCFSPGRSLRSCGTAGSSESSITLTVR